jgi:hypothetical protein
MTRGPLVTIGICATVLGLAGLVSGPVTAQFFSNKDGYTADGTYRVQVELSPYVWLP